MTVLTPPGYVQGGSYTAKLDRVYNTTTRVVADASTQLRARQGFYTGRAPVYANPSGWNITMSACAGVVANTFASNSGDYELANDGTVQVTLAASSPTLNRQDIIGFQVKDNLFDGSALNTAIPAVIQGANSAGASADPALPASFIPVLRAVVPAASAAPTLQTLVRYTTNDGGFLRIDSATHRGELTPFAGLRIWRSDRGWYETHDGTAWRVEGVAICTSVSDRDSAITSPRSGQFAVTTDLDILWQYDGATTAWVPTHAIGLVGGRDITGSNNLGGAITTVETMPTNLNSGAISLLANRRYRVHARIKILATQFDDWVIRVREGAAAFTGGAPGNPIRQFVWRTSSTPFGYTLDIFATYKTGAATETRVFSVTGQAGGAPAGTLQFLGGDAGDDNLVGVTVYDEGPVSKVTVTAS